MADPDDVGGNAAPVQRVHYAYLRGSEVASFVVERLADPRAQGFAIIFKTTPQTDGTYRVEVFRGRRVRK